VLGDERLEVVDEDAAQILAPPLVEHALQGRALRIKGYR
jgi:hypothetical protein